MSINQLVQFCHNSYERNGVCQGCENECKNSCLACLESIHDVNNRNRTYNCRNIVFCYTCKYIYRYSSEIEYLLREYSLVFNNVRRLRVCSVGCGPCSELFGLHNFKTRNNLNFEIDFTGFETNQIWQPIHSQITKILDCDSRFVYGDIFEYYDNQIELPNIIVLNYLLSDILRTNNEDFANFINSLCDLFRRMPNSALIVNDINLGKNITQVRAHFDPLITRLQAENDIRYVSRFHFANSQRWFATYGTLHDNNQLATKPMAEIEASYSPWLECRSAQFIIFKRAEQ